MSIDVTGVLTEAALTLAELGELRVSVGGWAAPNEQIVDAIASLPGSKTQETLYMYRDGVDEPSVIRSAEATVGHVTLHAQCSRLATSAEVESASGWTEHVRDFRSATIRRSR